MFVICYVGFHLISIGLCMCVCCLFVSCASQNKKKKIVTCLKAKKGAHWSKDRKTHFFGYKDIETISFISLFFTNQRSFLIKDTGNNKKAWRERFHKRHAISLPPNSSFYVYVYLKIDSTPWYSSDWLKKRKKNKQKSYKSLIWKNNFFLKFCIQFFASSLFTAPLSFPLSQSTHILLCLYSLCVWLINVICVFFFSLIFLSLFHEFCPDILSFVGAYILIHFFLSL